MQLGREGVERMMSRAAPQRWVGVGRDPKHQGMKPRSPVQRAREVHQPVVNDRAGKRNHMLESPEQQRCGAARHGGLRLQACART